jgi:hypothetical protein
MVLDSLSTGLREALNINQSFLSEDITDRAQVTLSLSLSLCLSLWYVCACVVKTHEQHSLFFPSRTLRRSTSSLPFISTKACSRIILKEGKKNLQELAGKSRVSGA